MHKLNSDLKTVVKHMPVYEGGVMVGSFGVTTHSSCDGVATSGLVHTKGAGIDLYEDDYKPVIESASCPHCDFTTSARGLFKTHMNEFHPGEPIIWPEREKQPDVSVDLQCPYCAYLGTTSRRLVRHLVSVHRDTSRVKKDQVVNTCDICQYMALDSSEFSKHMSTHMVTDKPYICDLCGYSTRERRILDEHRVVIHKDPRIIENTVTFQCDQCPYLTLRESRYLAHMRTHTGDKPFRCDKCSYATSSQNSLGQHKLTRHKDTSAAGRSRIYQCDECDYMSLHLGAFERHTWTHTGHKPFKCKHCDYSAGSSSNLDRHLKAVHGGKSNGSSEWSAILD